MMENSAAAANTVETVADYLTAHTDSMIASLHTKTEGLCESLQQRADSAARDLEAASASDTPVPQAFEVLLRCASGFYAGKTYTLYPRRSSGAAANANDKTAVCIGRSSGKWVKQYGVSLPKDPEVSTVHARIETNESGQVVFKDDDSTNGSWVDGAKALPHVPHVLYPGMVCTVGACELVVVSCVETAL